MDDRETIRSLEGFHNKRFLAFAALALLTFAVVLFEVVAGFGGSHVWRSADAMVAGPRSPAAMYAAPSK